MLIVLLGLTVPLVGMRARPLITILLAVGLGVAFTVGVQLAFNSGTILTFVYPLGALILATAGTLTTQLVTEAFERIRTRDLFTRFVPEDVVDEVLASSDGLRLGGVQREGTVMFSDLRGFTSMAETLTPARVIEVLNHYLSEMSDAILNHGGTLVAYMGDGIMAVFGAPLPQDDHADRALAAALEMRDERLPRFNEWLRSEELSEGFRMGIGLNSGSVMSGHVGLRAAGRVHRRGRHDQHGLPDRGHDQGHPASAALLWIHQGGVPEPARRHRRVRRGRDPRARREDDAVVAARAWRRRDGW